MRVRHAVSIAIAFALQISSGCLRGQTTVALQPLAQHIRRLEDALNYLGQPLPAALHNRLNAAIGMEKEEQAVGEIQKLLDPYVLATVNINAESRVKVTQGDAKPE